MTIFLKILLLSITLLAFMGVLAEKDLDQKFMYAAITIAGIAGVVTAFIFL